MSNEKPFRKINELVEALSGACQELSAGTLQPDGLELACDIKPEVPRVLVGDPYPDQLFASAGAIAGAAGLGRWAGWGVAWQSAGRTPEPWRGPDILQVIDDLAATGRADGIVVVPHGFTSDHLEVLYDVDIEARARAAALGLQLGRPAVVNADQTVMAALAARVAATARDDASSAGDAVTGTEPGGASR